MYSLRKCGRTISVKHRKDGLAKYAYCPLPWSLVIEEEMSQLMRQCDILLVVRVLHIKEDSPLPSISDETSMKTTIASAKALDDISPSCPGMHIADSQPRNRVDLKR